MKLKTFVRVCQCRLGIGNRRRLPQNLCVFVGCILAVLFREWVFLVIRTHNYTYFCHDGRCWRNHNGDIK